MKEIIFVTGNSDKIRHARTILAEFGFAPRQEQLKIVEIQAEEGEPIVRDKAQKAYNILKQPLIANDDSWSVPALNGFPGPYMASMNHYFKPEDFLRLFSTITDRRIILHQHIVYQDERGQQYFVRSIEGTLLQEVRRPAHLVQDIPCLSVISLTSDGKSMAELIAEDKSSASLSGRRTAWHDLGEWLQAHKA